MKTNKTFLSVLFILLSGLFGTASAQNYRFSLGPALGTTQFNLNESNIVADFSSLSSSSDFEDSITAFSFFGGIPLDPYLSIEMDLLFSGDVAAEEGSRKFKLFDVTTLALTLALSKQLGERTRVFGRMGAHFWDISQSSGDLDTINSAVDLTYGLGADINIYGDRSRQLRIQWNHYEYDGVYLDSSDTISLGLVFVIGAE